MRPASLEPSAPLLDPGYLRGWLAGRLRRAREEPPSCGRGRLAAGGACARQWQEARVREPEQFPCE